MYKSIAKNKRNTVLIMGVFVALIGAIGWAVAYMNNGNASIGVTILIIGAIYALFQYFAASKLAVAMTGAVEIQKKDNPRLFRIIENLAITMGMPMPKVYIINDQAPNAFATGRSPEHAIVGVTTGLLEIMDDNELEAVMAHEMGHVKNYDIRVSTIAFGLVSLIGFIADIAIRMLIWGDNRNNNTNPFVMVIGFAVILLSPLIASMTQLAISRQREFLADATSVMTTRHPDGMTSALAKLGQYGKPMEKQNTSTANLFLVNPLKKGFFSRMFSTHPNIKDRINRINENKEKF
ncbi:M48 family metalloprotease [Candidatus Saccharibacteria bacterium]|nr:M48 family metalloprotease [Candidatus Saccharibacteria bacterium]